MTLSKYSPKAYLLGFILVVAGLTFLGEWQQSPLHLGIAWYRLKTGHFSTEMSLKKDATLLWGDNFEKEVPFISAENMLSSTETATEPFVTISTTDEQFPLTMTYTFPAGTEGQYELEHFILTVEGKTATTYSRRGKTITEPLARVGFLGKKEHDDLKAELLAQWKILTTSYTKKEGKTAENLLTTQEYGNFSKTTKLSDLSYRLGATTTITLQQGEETATSIQIGHVQLTLDKCSVTAKIPIIYLKETHQYRFSNVYEQLSTLCAKPKPKPANNVLTCGNCWLAPVSKTYALSANYEPYVVKTGLNGGGYVTRDTQKALAKLFTDAKANGVTTIRVSSSYRSYDTQESLFNTYVNNEKRNGLSTAKAIEKANTYSAKPGHSEHQLGTTVDLMACSSPCQFYDSKNTPLYTYLKENAHTFGFIISYPNGSQSYTGYVYEPWHIRYIGVTRAKELYNRGYLEQKGYYLYQYLVEKGEY